MGNADNKPQLIINGKRLDGRGPADIRDIKIIPNPVKNAAGSAYIEWGRNKIIAAVHGPKEALPKHFADPERAIIKCRYMMAPFSSLEEHGRTGPNRRSIEISKVTKEVFENVVMLDLFPGTEIDLFVEVLQGDGGTRAAGITAAAVAMALSGIPMTDIPYAISAGKIGDTIVLDMDKIEDNYSDADMPVAVKPLGSEILLLQMDGSFTKEQLKQGIEMIMGCGKKIRAIQEEAIRSPYQRIMEKYEK